VKPLPSSKAIMARCKASLRLSEASACCRANKSLTRSRTDCECTEVTRTARVPAVRILFMVSSPSPCAPATLGAVSVSAGCQPIELAANQPVRGKYHDAVTRQINFPNRLLVCLLLRCNALLESTCTCSWRM
jgi:hypothetical protein